MKSWIAGANSVETDFTIHNIPLGLFSRGSHDERPCPGTRLGDTVVDLSILAASGLLDELVSAPTREALTAGADSLAPVADLPVLDRRQLRLALQSVFSQDKTPDGFPQNALLNANAVQMLLPFRIGDYTDFCISVEHMKNAGRQVAGDARIPPQMPYMPIGYHGRASSVIVSGTPFKRPCGLYKLAPSDPEPVCAPTARLDYEVEMAFYVSGNTKLGQRLNSREAEEAIFGVVLMNDWSARDIQSYEMMPLGPFQGKNFATTVSPWVISPDALKPFEIPLPERLVPELVYLQDERVNRALDINLSVEVQIGNESQVIAGNINAKDFYWSMPQLLVHQTMSGCNVSTGDLIATGTCSGTTPNTLGSIVEVTEGGRKPWQLPSGKERTFIENGDTVIMRGRCSKDGIHLGFGECSGLVLSADPM